MAVDFQIVHPQEVIPLNSVTVQPGPPRYVEVIGKDFRSVDEVMINQVASDDVAVMNKNRLLAAIPSALSGQRVTSVKVLSRKLTLSERSLIRFRVGKSPGKVTGSLRLLQKFLKILFTTPGSDIFDPTLGGGALKAIGRTFGYNEGNEILNTLVIAVDTTARQLVALQARDSSIPLDERLLSAKIQKAEFNKRETTVDVVVELISQAGQRSVANVRL
jgi:hypothetical protein